jgi:hypothetical protein
MDNWCKGIRKPDMHRLILRSLHAHLRIAGEGSDIDHHQSQHLHLRSTRIDLSGTYEGKTGNLLSLSSYPGGIPLGIMHVTEPSHSSYASLTYLDCVASVAPA